MKTAVDHTLKRPLATKPMTIPPPPLSGILKVPDRGSSLTPEQEKIIRQAGRGRPWKADCPAAQLRNETLCATRHFGRAFWKRWTGYHAPSWIAAKDPDRQTAEIQIRVAIMNRFNALGIAEIIRVA